MQIFVSSTCHDLVDVRAEVSGFIRELGFSPLLSDDANSDFEIHTDRDSIATCLANVRVSDLFVLILSQRYGPTLKKAGFPDISATHLEYDTAKAADVPIFVFARDRFVGAFDLWEKDPSKYDWNLSRWVSKKDEGLFQLFQAHARLKAGSTSNWYTTFRTSTDLKASLGVALRADSITARLQRLVDTRQIPSITVFQRGLQQHPGAKHVGVEIRVHGGPEIVRSASGDSPGKEQHPLPALSVGNPASAEVILRDTDPRSELNILVSLITGDTIRYRFVVETKSDSSPLSIRLAAVQAVESKSFRVLGPEDDL